MYVYVRESVCVSKCERESVCVLYVYVRASVCVRKCV